MKIIGLMLLSMMIGFSSISYAKLEKSNEADEVKMKKSTYLERIWLSQRHVYMMNKNRPEERSRIPVLYFKK